MTDRIRRHYVEITPVNGKYHVRCKSCPWIAKPKNSSELAKKVAREHRESDAI